MLYAADVTAASLRDRVFVSLAADAPHADLWWISLDGIFAREADLVGAGLLPHPPASEPGGAISLEDGRLHPKYKIPARCSPTSATQHSHTPGTFPTSWPMARSMLAACPRRSRRSSRTTGARMLWRSRSERSGCARGSSAERPGSSADARSGSGTRSRVCRPRSRTGSSGPVGGDPLGHKAPRDEVVMHLTMEA